MTDKDFDDNEVRPGEGPEAHASGPDPQDGESGLTVDDILSADQTNAALAGDDAVDLPPEGTF